VNDGRIAICSGGFAVIGGLAWVAATAIHGSQPRGCVGPECATVSMRDATTATSLLMALAGLLMVLSGAGLLTLVKRRNGLAWPGRLGAALCGVGVVVLALAVTLNAVFFDGDFSWMPAFVVPGIVALAAGLALVAWTVLRSGVVPTWLGLALLGGALLLLATNEQTSAVLLAIPFGLAWTATGAFLLVRQPSDRPSASDAPATTLVGE
jgi:hypothetical protein